MEHPILAACATIADAVKDVAEVDPVFMTATDKADALHRLARLQAQLAELRLRVIAEAGDLAESAAAHTVAEWLTVHTRALHEEARADHRLAVALDRRYAALARGLREGEVSEAQARVIARALDDLPDEVPADLVALAERTLAGHCGQFGPRQLARLGRRILDVVAPELADAAEARRLSALEAEAHRRTRLTLRRVGDGTTRLSGLLPDQAATRLATYLEAFTNPRKADEAGPAGVAGRATLARTAYPRRLGQAFCQLLEAVDPLRLPIHGGDATTVLVTIDLDSLRRELAVADVLGSHVPGDAEAQGFGETITAAQARRLACTAAIIPVVLGGDSEPLDLGRSRRLFNAPQRRAMRVRDRECRAEGCTIPAAWCEAHHLADPWTRGGKTDVADGALLCAHHHQRAHDPAFVVSRLPTGDLRYHRRR